MAENVEPLWGELLEAPAAAIEPRAPCFLFRNCFDLGRQDQERGTKQGDLIQGRKTTDKGKATDKGKSTDKALSDDKESGITLVPPKKRQRLPFKEITNSVLDDHLPQIMVLPHTKPSICKDDKVPIQSDYLLCSQYAAEIYKNYSVAEHEKRAVWGYMNKLQCDLTPKMRAMLVDWMVQVCDRFGFCSDTLYLSVYLVDRFLAKSKLAKEKLVVLGTSCILIALKYEERRCRNFTVGQLFIHTECTKAEVLRMETQVLSMVGYDISVPTVNTFLRRYLQFTEVSPQSQPAVELVASFLSELTLLDYNFLRYLPSEIAASAVLLAKGTIDPSSHPWNENLTVETGYRSTDLTTCIFNLKKIRKHFKRSDYNSIYEKFQRKKLSGTFFSVPELSASLFC